LPAVVLKRGNEQFMFDCGEGVQRQMILAKTGFHKKLKIFLTHMHGDHVLGLPGLLQTMALMERKKPVEIYGPVGTIRFIEDLRETLQFNLTYNVEIHEIVDSGLVCNEEEYFVVAEHSNHVIPSFAIAFIEKPRPGRFYPEKAKALGVVEGKAWSKLQNGQQIVLPNGKIVKPEEVSGPQRRGRKIVYTGDTRPFKEFADFAAGADLLIHESTFDDSLLEKAEVDGHSTPSQAAESAKSAGAKKLVLTHLSARYSEPQLLLEQAKKVFVSTQVAEDFLELELPLIE
jgi:ribonuclease Z